MQSNEEGWCQGIEGKDQEGNSGLLDPTSGYQGPMPAEIYKLGEYLSNAFSACSQAALVSGLAVYPEFPKDVGGEPWMNSMVPVFCMLCKLLSLRSLLVFWFILFI